MYLADAAAGWVTGVVLPVDGGLLAGRRQTSAGVGGTIREVYGGLVLDELRDVFTLSSLELDAEPIRARLVVGHLTRRLNSLG